MIERDALGIALLKYVVDTPDAGIPLLRLDRSFPLLSSISSTIRSELNCDLKLTDITTDLEIPTILASLQWLDGSSLVSLGSASHLDARTAIIRAVMEAVQIYYADLHYPEERPLVSKNSDALIHRSCLDAGASDYGCHEEFIDLGTWLEEKSALAPEHTSHKDTLPAIISRLDNFDFTMFWRELQSPIEGLPVTCL